MHATKLLLESCCGCCMAHEAVLCKVPQRLQSFPIHNTILRRLSILMHCPCLSSTVWGRSTSYKDGAGWCSKMMVLLTGGICSTLFCRSDSGLSIFMTMCFLPRVLTANQALPMVCFPLPLSTGWAPSPCCSSLPLAGWASTSCSLCSTS